MSLWWAKREQLDDFQLKLIEKLPLRGNYLITGPPGSGKTNVLLRRAQFVRSQDMPNILVLTFTRPLTEFVKTGCFDPQGREIFPMSCVSTLEQWLRGLYEQHGCELPDKTPDLNDWKIALAKGALGFIDQNRLPRFDALFIDEAQDLLPEEVELLNQWSPVIFVTGDDRQRIFANADGLTAVRTKIPKLQEHVLPFHYRIAPELCRMADRILAPKSGDSLESTSHYAGPRPGTITVQGPFTRELQLEAMADKLKDQIRVYGDLIQYGDRLGIIVARKEDREAVYDHLEQDPDLEGKSKIIRARADEDDNYDPSFEADTPICILTVQGCKGLEFRAVHWPFCEELSWHHNNEHYYTVTTRAKTSLDIYFTKRLPQVLARAYSPAGEKLW